MATLTRCIKCGREISKEESQARYNEIWEKYMVVPNMVAICKECREEKKHAQQTDSNQSSRNGSGKT